MVLDGEPEAAQTFADALDEAILASDRTLDAIQRRLHDRGFEVSVASLSYWRTGRSVPSRKSSLQAIPHLEEILALSPGQLATKLPTTTSRSRRPREAALPPDIRSVVQDCLEELGLALEQELLDVSVHLTVDVGPDGSTQCYRMRNVVRAAREGAQRMPAIVTESDRLKRPQLVTGPGCHLGRVVRRAEAGVYAAEVVLDRPLVRDALAIVEHGEDFDPGVYTDAFMTYVALRRLREVAVWVRFDESRLPTGLTAHHDTSEGEVAIQTELIGNTAVVVLHDFGPGQVGLRWTW